MVGCTWTTGPISLARIICTLGTVSISQEGEQGLWSGASRGTWGVMVFREGVEVIECPAGFFQIDSRGKTIGDMRNGNVKRRNSGLRLIHFSLII